MARKRKSTLHEISYQRENLHTCFDFSILKKHASLCRLSRHMCFNSCWTNTSSNLRAGQFEDVKRYGYLCFLLCKLEEETINIGVRINIFILFNTLLWKFIFIDPTNGLEIVIMLALTKKGIKFFRLDQFLKLLIIISNTKLN